MNVESKKEKLLTHPINKLFYAYLLPSVSGTFVTSVYILADSVIIGKKIGQEALTALNIVLPIFSLFFSIGLLFGVGGSILLSIERGKGNEEKANCFFTLSLFLNLLVGGLAMLLCFGCYESLVLCLGGSELTIPYINQYLPTILWGGASFFFSTFFQAFIRNDKAPKLAMIAVITGGISNIILDIVFVIGWNMGMKGAALATVLGSVIVNGILLTHFFSKKNGLVLVFPFQTLLKNVLSIIKNGSTSFLVDISTGIVTLCFNLQLIKYMGDIGVTVYGIIANVTLIFYSLCNGVNQAAQPIISTNFGAGKMDRINQVKKLAIKNCVVVCLIPFVIAMVAPNLFTYIFIKPSEQVLRLAPKGIRIFFLGFLFAGYNIAMTNYFQSVTAAGRSLLLCLLRGIVLCLSFVFILPIWLGVTGIWLAVPLGEGITFLVALAIKRSFHTNKNSF